MDDFTIKKINDIIVVKTELLGATHRDASPFWNEIINNSVFDWDKIIIDVSSCHYVDSTFIGMIVKIYREVSKKNGQLKLVFPQKEGIDSFKFLGITKVIECFNTLSSAVNSFGSEIPMREAVLSETILSN